MIYAHCRFTRYMAGLLIDNYINNELGDRYMAGLLSTCKVHRNNKLGTRYTRFNVHATGLS